MWLLQHFNDNWQHSYKKIFFSIKHSPKTARFGRRAWPKRPSATWDNPLTLNPRRPIFAPLMRIWRTRQGRTRETWSRPGAQSRTGRAWPPHYGGCDLRLRAGKAVQMRCTKPILCCGLCCALSGFLGGVHRISPEGLVEVRAEGRGCMEVFVSVQLLRFTCEDLYWTRQVETYEFNTFLDNVFDIFEKIVYLK